MIKYLISQKIKLSTFFTQTVGSYESFGFNFKKMCFIFFFAFTLLSVNSNTVQAANFFGVTDPGGCESKDPFLPNLLICGRSTNVGACEAYTKPCTLGDLVETGRRMIIWLISIVLLIIPLFFTYYGVKLMFEMKMDGNIGYIKELKGKIWTLLIYFILLLSAWLIVKGIVDIFQVKQDVPTFLIDKDGNEVKAKQFDMSR